MDTGSRDWDDDDDGASPPMRRFCPWCGAEIITGRPFCPSCGRSLDPPQKSAVRKVVEKFGAAIALAVAVVVGIVILAASVGLLRDNDEAAPQEGRTAFSTSTVVSGDPCAGYYEWSVTFNDRVGRLIVLQQQTPAPSEQCSFTDEIAVVSQSGSSPVT